MPRFRNPISVNQFDSIIKNPICPVVGEVEPLQLGLLLWLDTTVSSSLDASSDGDLVGSWTDRRGGGKTASQSTGSRKPLLKIGIQNGLPVVRTDGVDDQLDLGDDADFELDDFSIYMIVQRLSINTGDGLFCMQHQVQGAFDLAGILIDFLANNKLRFIIKKESTGFIQVVTVPTYAANQFFIISFIKSGTSHQLRVDGVEPSFTIGGASNVPAVVDYTTSTTKRTLLFESYGDGGGSPPIVVPHHGDMGELLVYDNGHSDSERDGVEQYLSNKRGISIP